MKTFNYLIFEFVVVAFKLATEILKYLRENRRK